VTIPTELGGADSGVCEPRGEKPQVPCRSLPGSTDYKGNITLNRGTGERVPPEALASNDSWN